MSAVALCALLPLALAVITGVRQRALGNAVLALALGGLAAGWLWATQWRCDERVLIVADSRDQLEAAIETFTAQSAKSSVVGCAVATLSHDKRLTLYAPLAWNATCQPDQASDLANPADAVQLVEASSRGRGALRRFVDWVRGRRYRVVFVVGDARAWQERKWLVSVPEQVRRLRAVGIVADVIDATAAARVDQPALSIIPRMTYIPTFSNETERFTFDLAAEHLPGRAPATVERACILDGDCFDNADCSDGRTCTANRCTAAGTPGQPTAPWVLERDAVAVTTAAASVTTKTPISIADFTTGGRVALPQGWHPLRCWIWYGPDKVQLTAQIFVVSKYPLFSHSGDASSGYLQDA